MNAETGISRRWTLPLLLGLAVLGAISLYLGWTRILQVDEAEKLMLARILGTHRTADFLSAAPLMILGPISWMARAATSTADLVHQVRLLFVGLMWINFVLMVKGAGGRLRSTEGLVLLILAATLEPMWDYGFEIRHDNLLLTGLLGMWLLLRAPGRPAPRPFLFAGLLAALLQFVAYKAFLYTLPILAIFLILPGPVLSRGRLRAIAEMAVGLLAGALLGWLAHRLSGTWTLFTGGVQVSTQQSLNGIERFAPWATLQRLLLQTPLMVGGILALLAAPFIGLGGAWKADLQRIYHDPDTPEWVLLALAMGAFLANPTPFPYNLVLVVPFAFIALARRRALLLEALQQPKGWLLGSVLAAGHLLPWATATPRHFEMSNERQLQVAALAESLTDPARHRVLDGSGLVVTRQPAGFYWLIHTFTIRPLSDGTFPSIRSQLAAAEVPVVLPNYRLGWLPEADKTYIAAHYVAIASDILVLGARFQGGQGSWEALAEGNYVLVLQGQVPKDARVDVDGKPCDPGPLKLSKGGHTFRFPAGTGLSVLWSGPQGGTAPAIANTREPLFFNWY